MRKKRRNLTADVPLSELRAIPGFPGYFITRDGQAFSIGKLSVHDPGDGYLRFQAHKDNGSRVVRHRPGVHQAIALAFLGPPPSPDMQVCHKDGNSTNNLPENLYWGTVKENGRDRATHGRLKGTKNPKAKLSASDVATIKKRIANGEGVSSIHADFPFVSSRTIGAIKSGRNWSHYT